MTTELEKRLLDAIKHLHESGVMGAPYAAELLETARGTIAAFCARLAEVEKERNALRHDAGELVVAQYALSAAETALVAASAQIATMRADTIDEILNLLTAHELYLWRPKAFAGFIAFVRALNPKVTASPGSGGTVDGGGCDL